MTEQTKHEPPPGYREVSLDDLASHIGEGVHTGLRKGSFQKDSHDLWKAISDSETSAWADAVSWFAYILKDSYGWLIYEPHDDTARCCHEHQTHAEPHSSSCWWPKDRNGNRLPR